MATLRRQNSTTISNARELALTFRAMVNVSLAPSKFYDSLSVCRSSADTYANADSAFGKKRRRH